MAGHAGSVWVGQVAVMAFGVVDTIVAGRHSDLSLAALAVGSAVFITVYVSLFGLLSALLPIWAELHGARRLTQLGRSARQSLYVCALASALGMAVLLFSTPLLRLAEVPPDLQPVAANYLAVVGWSLPAEKIGPALQDWARWGQARHDYFLRAADLARAITFVAETPRGGFIANMELQPEAPLADNTSRQKLALGEEGMPGQ